MQYMAKRPTSKAFTLIEMLVVIAIIAVLASLLMPALFRAVEAGRSVSCANRNRQMLIGLEGLLDELNGLYPSYTTGTLAVPSPTLGARYDATGNFTYHRWYWHVKDYMGTSFGNGYQDGTVQALLDKEEWHLCPSNTSKTGQDWIAYNMFFGYRWANSGDGKRKPHERVLRNQVIRPSASFVFADRMYDHNPDTGSARYYQCEAVSPTSIQPFDYYHHNGYPVFGFADGHAKSISTDELFFLVDDDSRSKWLSGNPRNYFTTPKDYLP